MHSTTFWMKFGRLNCC